MQAGGSWMARQSEVERRSIGIPLPGAMRFAWLTRKVTAPSRGCESDEGSATILAMPIVGHGIDIVETGRIRKLHAEHGQRFLDRCFTPLEQTYCARNPKRYFE